MENPRYTLILDDVKKELGLTLLEYILCDKIYHLSNNPKHQGWCYASRKTLAKMIDVTDRTIYNLLNKLISKGLIELDKETNFLKTTQLWFDKAVGTTEKISYSMKNNDKDNVNMTKRTSVDTTERISYNNNSSIDSNKEKDIVEFLNSTTRSQYKVTTKSTQRHITARLREGFTVSDFKK